jgi:hypothetical protein
MPQFSYDHPVLLLGQIASTNPWTINSYLNALLAQESGVTIGGTDAGDYTIQFDGPSGSYSITYTHPGGGVTNDIVAGLLTELQSDPDLVNIVVGTNADPQLTLDFIHPGEVWVLSFPSNPAGNMTAATIQAAGGTDLDLGVVVVPVTPPENSTGAQHVGAPDVTATDADFLGITVRASIDVEVNDGDPTGSNVFRPGATVSVMEEGEAVVEVEDAVAFNGPVFVRINNPGPGQKLGGLRSDADGGNAIQMTGARFRSATSGLGLAKVAINRP